MAPQGRARFVWSSSSSCTSELMRAACRDIDIRSTTTRRGRLPAAPHRIRILRDPHFATRLDSHLPPRDRRHAAPSPAPTVRRPHLCLSLPPFLPLLSAGLQRASSNYIGRGGGIVRLDRRQLPHGRIRLALTRVHVVVDIWIPRHGRSVDPNRL